MPLAASASRQLESDYTTARLPQGERRTRWHLAACFGDTSARRSAGPRWQLTQGQEAPKLEVPVLGVGCAFRACLGHPHIPW